MPTNFCNNRQDLICEKKYFLFLKNWNSLFSTEISQIRNLLQLSSIFSKKHIFKCVAKKNNFKCIFKKKIIDLCTHCVEYCALHNRSINSKLCMQLELLLKVSFQQPKSSCFKAEKKQISQPKFQIWGRDFFWPKQEWIQPLPQWLRRLNH